MGIGAMIVFIAMVLVAGIAASVLVQTANKLEIQAMTTGDQTINQVATGLKVSSIAGHKSGTTLDLGYITVEPRAGAGDIDLSNAYIEISNSVQKCVLTYAGGYTTRSQVGGDMFNPAGTAYTLGAKDFGVMVLEDADGSVTNTTPVANLGDKVALTFDATQCFGAGLDVRVDVWGLVQPEEGSAGAFAFTTPASFAGGTVFGLYLRRMKNETHEICKEQGRGHGNRGNDCVHCHGPCCWDCSLGLGTNRKQTRDSSNDNRATDDKRSRIRPWRV